MLVGSLETRGVKDTLQYDSELTPMNCVYSVSVFHFVQQISVQKNRVAPKHGDPQLDRVSQ